VPDITIRLIRLSPLKIPGHDVPCARASLPPNCDSHGEFPRINIEPFAHKQRHLFCGLRRRGRMRPIP
jgi:hypothetical protein